MAVPSDAANALAEVSLAMSQTRDRRTARLLFERTAEFSDSTVLGSRAGKLIVGGLRRLARSRQWASVGEGVIDFESSRCVVKYSDGSIMIVGDRCWHGAAGQMVDDLSVQPAHAEQPLWMVDVAGALVDATFDGNEDIGANRCRRFRATADLTKAPDTVPYSVARAFMTDDDSLVPLELWSEAAGLVRRIRTRTRMELLTLDLTSFGPNASIDWSRLP